MPAVHTSGCGRAAGRQQLLVAAWQSSQSTEPKDAQGGSPFPHRQQSHGSWVVSQSCQAAWLPDKPSSQQQTMLTRETLGPCQQMGVHVAY